MNRLEGYTRWAYARGQSIQRDGRCNGEDYRMTEFQEHPEATHTEPAAMPDLAGPVTAAGACAAQSSTDEQPMGTPGRPFNRRSPFFVGMTAAAGVAVTYAIIQALLGAQSVLILIGLAMFLAVGLEPAVAFLTRRKM